MAKFFGVISNSAKSSSAQQVLEFSDLELLSNCLFNETQNLYYEFLEKLKFINDRDLIIYENSKKLAQMYEYLLAITLKLFVMERETLEIGNYLRQVENSICHMQINIQDFPCKSHKERDKILNLHLMLSDNVYRMEHQVEEIKEQECLLSMENLCCWTHRLMPFLELHTRILLQVESKLSRINEYLKDIERMFYLVINKTTVFQKAHISRK